MFKFWKISQEVIIYQFNRIKDKTKPVGHVKIVLNKWQNEHLKGMTQ